MSLTRRTFLATAATPFLPGPRLSAQAGRIKVAALSSTYHMRSHSDNFITRFLEGYWIGDQYHESPGEIVSLYVDQEHPADISTRLSKAWGFKKYSSIEDALTLGGKKLAVDAVLQVVEHGNYPTNVKNQHLYPRYEFMERVVNVFKKSGRSVPFFTDKHLSYDWKKAKQMYDWSREMGFPMMAGSSVPVTFRRPELDLPIDSDLESAIAVGGGWVGDGGLFHVMDTLQAFTERRKGGETGVKSVQLVEGDAVWESAKQGLWDRSLLDAALARGDGEPGPVEKVVKKPVACLVEYNDGFRAAGLAMGAKAGGYLAAVKIKGEAQPRATLCYIPIENSNNFSPLVHAIGRCFNTGKHDFPLERTLLSTGALSFLMESWYQGQKRLETPMLDIRYRAPKESYFARGMGS
ncbi:MAG: hypothetical protein R2748_27950 [Bryobacterales bacterium]